MMYGLTSTSPAPLVPCSTVVGVWDYANVVLSAKQYLRCDSPSVIAPLLSAMIRSYGRLDGAHAYLDAGRSLHWVRQTIAENGFTIVDAPDHPQGDGYKSSVDPAIISDLIAMGYERDPGTLVLASGDRDFLIPVERLRRRRWHVVVIGVRNSTSTDLIAASDEFIPLTIPAA